MIYITGTVSTTDDSVPLGVEIWLDSTQIINCTHLAGDLNFFVPVDNDESPHQLKFVMKNKRSEHTTVDADGNIVKDALLKLHNIRFDDVPVDQYIVEHAVYLHGLNHLQQPIEDRFYGSMGCNGNVIVDFYTPIELWMLEQL